MILNGETIEPERLYTPSEWAKIRQVTIKTLAKNRCLRVGEPYLKVGRSVFYRGSDIITHFDKSLKRTGPEATLKHAAKGAA